MPMQAEEKVPEAAHPVTVAVTIPKEVVARTKEVITRIQVPVTTTVNVSDNRIASGHQYKDGLMELENAPCKSSWS